MTKILIVEDDKTNCDMLERLLSIHGYEVITAPDGAKALSAARDQQPDLIIMDMGLPILNGWQATYRLKSSSATCHIPVIALTAYALTEDRTRCLAVGCDDYDTKPIDLPRLLGKIKTHLDRATAVGFVVSMPTGGSDDDS
ncbi:response regulator [Oscillochloris sp. ZM17-4]|uniref:response regulator n=1 Tax=Oscillochloris sp. ZM17-4 TaxID=2866714 RepID=UPI001C736862|nr:response regulator [Oscillochloris sp. ZM17-4]MBX0330564.1 response regulator [Oscillochloris sp. ZM17-4]